MRKPYEKVNGRWLVWVMGQYDSRGGTFAHLIGGERWPSVKEVHRWYVEDGPLSAMIDDGISEEEAWQGLEELGVVEISGADAENENKLEEIIRELAKKEKGYDGIELEWSHGGPGIIGVKWKDTERAKSMPDHEFISKEDVANVDALVFMQTKDCWCDEERVDRCTITRLERKRRKEASVVSPTLLYIWLFWP